MQVTRRYWVLLVLLLFLSGCQIQKTAPEIAGPFTPGPERDSVLEAQRIAFSPELEETWEWIVLDAEEEQILYAIQEKCIDQEQMYSYRLTREIGIYDADRSQVTAQWQPETPGCIRPAPSPAREAPAVPEPWTIPMFIRRSMSWSVWIRSKRNCKRSMELSSSWKL